MPSLYYTDRMSGNEYHRRTHEPSNRQRAEWGEIGLEAFRSEIMPDEDDDTTMCDFLCDLMHWCKRNRVDFDHALARGRDHFRFEIEAEKPEKERDKVIMNFGG